MRRFDFAVCANLFPRNSLECALTAMRSCGFTRVQLWGHVAHFHPGYVTSAEAARLAERVRDQGMEIASLFPEGGSYPLNPAAAEAHLRQRSVDYYRRCLDLAAAMGIHRVVLHPGYGLLDRDERLAMDNAVHSWQVIGEYARELGLDAQLKNCAAVHLGSLGQLDRLIERSGVGLGICADVGLALDAGTSPAELMAMAEVRGLNVSDGPGGHLAFGDGHYDLKNVCGEIEACGWAERTTLVMDHRAYVLEPEAALRRTAERILEWRRTLEPTV